MTNAVSKALLALTVVMVLEVFNPRQGGLAVGASGVLMYLVPLLWFWIGQRYGTPRLLSHLIYRVLLPLGVLAAVLGICQNYIGFLPWERLWIAEVSSHFASLQIGGGVSRAFGYSVSAAEYANLMLLATLCSAVAVFHRRRALILLFPLLATALFLSGSRGSIFKGIFGIAIGWAFSGRGGKGWALRFPLGLAVGALALTLVVSRVGGGGAGSSQPPASASQAASQHQIEGLAHPLEAKHSTLGLHASEFVYGLKQGFTYPIGNGLGATTIGAGRFGGSSEAAHGSEVDVSDAFITSGVVGGLLYLLVIGLTCQRALVFGRIAPKELSLPILAMLASLAGIWMAIGQYSIAPLTWFIVGSLSRQQTPKTNAL